MPFKYQAPSDYKSSCLVISGERYEVKNGTVQSEHDIYHVLKPMGFERQVEDAVPATSKKVATAATT